MNNFRMPARWSRLVLRVPSEKQLEFARLYRQTRESPWCEKLVFSCLAWVSLEAQRYARVIKRDPSFRHDLIQEGILGLLEAANRFDPDRGVPFLGYAHYWVTSYMRKFLYAQLGDIPVCIRPQKGRLRRTVLTAQSIVPLTDAVDWDKPSQKDLPFVIDWKSEERTQAILRAEWVRQVIGMVKKKFGEHIGEQFDRYFLSEEVVTLEQLGAEDGVSRERIRQRFVEVLSVPKIRRAIICVLQR